MQPSMKAAANAATWLTEHLLTADVSPLAALPFSFVFGDQPSSALLAQWPREYRTRELDAARTEHILLWTDSQSGLSVRCVIIAYRDFPTIEWTLYFKNSGKSDTPIIADIQALDTWIQRASGDADSKPVILQGVLIGQNAKTREFVLHHQTGSPCLASDYQPFETVLPPHASKRINTRGGRPTNSDLPYFNVAWQDQGMLLVLGWSGQWAAQFERDAGNGLHVRAGQEGTHFKLHPGEEVRSPKSVVQFYEGDWIHGQNIWRRWMLAHNMPRPHGQLPKPLTGTCIDGQFTGMRSHARAQIEAMDQMMGMDLPLTHWWIDAGWYECREWPQVGNWRVDQTRYPHGIREVFDEAHKRGLQTVLWFEPERVRPDTDLDQQHPEWLLKSDGKPNRLLNLGDEAARAWITERVDALIVSQGVDVYRQDFNFDPLEYWRANDAPDRKGITEVKYVTGYLAYWDELRRRHPDMLIDTCASGGRRNDLETLARSVPLLQSDYRFEPVSQQCHNYGISFWMPFHGTGTDQTEVNAYVFRSHMCSGLGYGWEIWRDGVPTHFTIKANELRRLVRQWQQIAPYYLGDYYPLTPYSLENDVWMAWQYDCPEQGEGMLQAFRRADSPYESARFKLRGLDPTAHYAVTDLDTGAVQQLDGHALMTMGWPVVLPNQPDSAIVTYKLI